MEKMRAQMGARMERHQDPPPTSPASSPWGDRSFSRTTTPEGFMGRSPTHEDHSTPTLARPRHRANTWSPAHSPYTPPHSTNNEALYSPMPPRAAHRLRRLADYSPSPVRLQEELSPECQPKAVHTRSPAIAESELSDIPSTPVVHKKKGMEKPSTKAKGKKRAVDELGENEDRVNTRRSSKRKCN